MYTSDDTAFYLPDVFTCYWKKSTVCSDRYLLWKKKAELRDVTTVFQEAAGEGIPILLLGNKMDMDEERQVSFKEAEQLAYVSFHPKSSFHFMCSDAASEPFYQKPMTRN